MGAVTRVILELDIEQDPPCGRLLADGGEPLPFDGYVALIHALQSLREANRPDSNQARQEGDRS